MRCLLGLPTPFRSFHFVIARSTRISAPRCPGTGSAAIHFSTWLDGLLRGVYHRARIRATRWLAMTLSTSHARTSNPQCFFRIAGDLLVAIGQGDQLVAADDVVDRSERPVVGALKHLAQDCVGRIDAVGQNDPRCYFEALLLISGKRGDDIAVAEQRRRH